MPTTYEPIATTTLSTTASSISFTSIPSTYTDLRLVSVQLTGSYPRVTLNSNTSTLYSQTILTANGAGSSSDYYSSTTAWLWGFNASNSSTIPSLYTLDIFSYTSSENKSSLFTVANNLNGTGPVYANGVVESSVGLFRSTSAISSIQINAASGTFAAGTTATLYGIKAA